MSKARGRTLADRRFRFTSEDRWGYFFIFVAMVVFVTFTLYPVVSAVRTSFLKYKPFGSEFIGLKNYIDTFKSALFYKAVKNTIVYTAVVVPLSLLIAFSIAIMILPFKKKTQSLFKSVYYLPSIASGVALSVGAGDPVTGAVWGAVVPVLGLDEPVAAGEPPVRPSRATAPQATSGTMMSTAASGIQLRHAGT